MKDNRILLTVIVPVYNCEENIAECIESILDAGNRVHLADVEKASAMAEGSTAEGGMTVPFQLILVDDGSVDRSGEICRRYAEESDCTEYYYQENSGVSTARNLGLSHANGEFISFVDGDDKVTENLFEGLFSGMDEKTDIVCCSCRTSFNGETGEEHFFPEDFLAETPEEKKKLYLQLLDEQYGRSGSCPTAIGVPWGKLYRKSLLDSHKLVFDPFLRRMQDNVFNMEAFAAARGVRYLDMSLYVYRLSHVSGYIRGTSLVDPKVLNRIALLRNYFFRDHPELVDEEIKMVYDADMVRFFGTSMQYYVVHEKSPDRAVKRIRSFCERSVIADELRNTDSTKMSRKRKLLLYLMKTCKYRSLYILYEMICRKQKLK